MTNNELKAVVEKALQELPGNAWEKPGYCSFTGRPEWPAGDSPAYLIGSKIAQAFPVEASNTQNRLVRSVMLAIGGMPHAARIYSRNNANANIEVVGSLCLRAFGHDVGYTAHVAPMDARLNSIPKFAR